MEKNIFEHPHLGMTFGFHARNGYFSSAAAKHEVDEMSNTNIEWVVLVVTVMQESFHSTRQFRDFTNTPNDLELKEIIDYIHSKGMKVQLRPMLECYDGMGRLAVTFPPNNERIPGRICDYARRWFESMTHRSVYYARIAEQTGCEMYCLDSELDSIISFNEEWKQVIHAVRKVYSGPVTSCHTIHTGVIDFEKVLTNKNHWFYDLDALSISDYIRCADRAGLSVEEMADNMISERNRLRRIAELYGKPVLFGEIGSTSSTGGAMQYQTDLYDEDEQANFLDAVLRVFSGEHWWKGLYWWKWDEHIARPWIVDPSQNDRGWTIKGKKAQSVMKDWYHTLQSQR